MEMIYYVATTSKARITNMSKSRTWSFCLALLLSSQSGLAAVDVNDPAVDALVNSDQYDTELCTVAQRVILNAGADDYETLTLVAKGGTFVAEQMNTDAANKTVTVAALLESANIGRESLPATMSCKMVNQDRVNAVLKLNLQEPTGTCGNVNELTYALALSRLADAEREHYLEEGTQLQFIDDYEAPAGGAWLASIVSDYIAVTGSDESPEQIIVQAPSVRVPWPGEEKGEWFQGTNHCKLITFAAMSRWMKIGAFDGSTELFPRLKPKCVEPDSRTSEVGSCLQYFGPSGAQLCQDYSGSGWTEQSARGDCAIRHATLDVWNQASDSYDGGGGIFNTQSCAERDVVAEAIREPVNQPESAYRGTCVFRCNTPDEALWHQLSPMANDPDGTGMERTCDLFLKVDW
jgi:hypothetical protein